MFDILYYDANQTVRALMKKALKGTPFIIVDIDKLEECETVLKSVKDPALLLIDLTRQPQMLVSLQRVVPGYISSPDRCILTSTKPSSLSPFMPKKMDDCFFKHVIERPFKIQELVGFMADILNVSLDKYQGSMSISLARTGINQIIHETQELDSIQAEESSIVKEVDDIVKSTSSAISMSELKKTAMPPNVLPNDGNSEDRVTFSHDNQKSEKPQDEMEWIRTSVNDEVELPKLVSPQIVKEVKAPPIPQAAMRKTLITEPSIEENRLSIYSLLNLLKNTMLHNVRRTLVCQEGERSHVVIIDGGRLLWIETLVNGIIIDEASFFHQSHYSHLLPVSQVINLIQKKMTVSMALSVLEADSMEFVLNHAKDGIHELMSLEGHPIQIYEDIPRVFMPFMARRPILGVDIMPLLFDYCRQNEESVIAPDIFRQARFVKRLCRTPLNAGVRLSKEESGIISAMATPVTLNILKATGKKGIADMLYRLVMFEFCDLVGGFGMN